MYYGGVVRRHFLGVLCIIDDNGPYYCVCVHRNYDNSYHYCVVVHCLYNYRSVLLSRLIMFDAVK